MNKLNKKGEEGAMSTYLMVALILVILIIALAFVSNQAGLFNSMLGIKE